MAQKDLILRFRSDWEDAVRGASEVKKGVQGIFDPKSYDGFGTALGGIGTMFGAMQSMAQRAMPFLQDILGAWRFLEGSILAYEERLRDSEAVSSVALRRLQIATGGLVRDSQLLHDVNLASQGDWALTSRQIENVALKAQELHRKGFGPVSEILSDILEKLRTGEVEGLKKYGLSLEDVQTKQEKWLKALEFTQTGLDGMRRATSSAGDEVTRTAVKMANAADEIRASVGFTWRETKDAIQQAEGRVRSLDVHLQDIAKTLVEQHNPALGKHLEKIEEWKQKLDEIKDRNLAVRNALAEMRQQWAAWNALVDQVVREGQEIIRNRDQRKQAREEQKRQHEAARREREEEAAQLEQILLGVRALRGEFLERADDGAIRLNLLKPWEDGLDLLARQYEAFNDNVEVGIVQSTENLRDLGATLYGVVAPGFEQAAATANNLVQVLDKPAKEWGRWRDDLKRLREEAEHYADTLKDVGVQAFQDFAQAGGEAFGMLVSGQQGAAAAFHEATYQLLQSLSMELFGLSFKALGMALLDSFWNPAAAASEFAAAGVFAAGALALGGLAAAVGQPSQAGAGGAAGAGGGTTAREGGTLGREFGSSNENRPQVVNNIYLGYGFVGDERALHRELNRGTEHAKLVGAVKTRRVPMRRAS